MSATKNPSDYHITVNFILSSTKYAIGTMCIYVHSNYTAIRFCHEDKVWF